MVVEQSDDASCLESAATASVVTQTVYMAQNGTRRSSNLDSRSLLITAILFGILFFAAAAGALYLYSLLRQNRKARFSRGGPRFDMTDDESSYTDGESTRGGTSAGLIVPGIMARYRKTSQNSDTSDGFEAAARPYTAGSKEKTYDEKAVSPTSTHGE